MIIPLLLLDAEVELASRSGEGVATRRMPLCDFFLAPGKTAIQPAELVTGVRFAAPGPGFVAGFKKFGARPAMDIAVVSVGIAGTCSKRALRQARGNKAQAARLLGIHRTRLRRRLSQLGLDGTD